LYPTICPEQKAMSTSIPNPIQTRFFNNQNVGQSMVKLRLGLELNEAAFKAYSSLAMTRDEPPPLASCCRVPQSVLHIQKKQAAPCIELALTQPLEPEMLQDSDASTQTLDSLSGRWYQGPLPTAFLYQPNTTVPMHGRSLPPKETCMLSSSLSLFLNVRVCVQVGHVRRYRRKK